jgi:hypothetical protein
MQRMNTVRSKRRLLFEFMAAGVALLLFGWLARTYLAGVALGSVLKQAGATEIRFNITQVSLWRVVVEDVGFMLRLQPFSAERVTLSRAHWWMSSLGTLRVETAQVPVNVDDLVAPPSAAGDQTDATKGGPANLPFEEISIDGQLIVQTADLPDQALSVTIEARPAAAGVWEGKAQVNGPGLGLTGEGRYDLGSGELTFKLPEVALDLQPWDGFVRRLVPVSEGDWEAAGKFSGSAEGRWAGGKLTASGVVRLRDGRLASTTQAITAEGIDTDLEFTDFAALTTKPGTLRIRELRTGKLTLTDLAADFSLEGPDRIAVTHATLKTLGGSVTAEPFGFVPSRAELDAALLADGISIEQVMALTEDLPAKATGRVNGRVPVRIDASGVKLGTGWLALTPGVQAEIEFNAKGLLTGGAAPSSPSYAVLQKVESGLLKLRISELRLDIRPTNVPAGRSAQLHLKGAPMDPEVKAPVILDLNVNGPLEKLINMGMDSRLSIGTKP